MNRSNPLSKLILLTTFMAALMLAGCASAPEAAPTTEPRQALAQSASIERSNANTGWILYENMADGFAVALPSSWVMLDMNAETMDSALEPIKQETSILEVPDWDEHNLDYFRTAGVRFMGLDLESDGREDGRFANVQIAIVKGPQDYEVTLDEVSAYIVNSLLESNEVIAYSRIHPPVGEMQQVQFRLSQDGVLTYLVQYYFVKGADIYVASFGIDMSHAGEYLPIFDQIIYNFDWVQPESASSQ